MCSPINELNPEYQQRYVFNVSYNIICKYYYLVQVQERESEKEKIHRAQYVCSEAVKPMLVNISTL